MLLELLAYAVLVEDESILSEGGFSRLPAADCITLLCSTSNLPVGIQTAAVDALEPFCSANNITNVGELISVLRNKLTHPTRKNREYLNQVPSTVHHVAVEWGIQIAELTLLRVVGYQGKYYDGLRGEEKFVPWRSPSN